MKEERFFYVPNASERLELPEEEAKHALRVLRLHEGDSIFLQDGVGNFYHAKVGLTNNKHCYYNITDVEPQRRQWKGRIHLGIGPTKMMERMEWMAEKATEIGFDELSFLSCKFSERKVIRTDRVEKIVTSAFKQSRKAWMPKVNSIVGFNDFIRQERTGRKFICHCYNEIVRKDFFSEISNEPSDDDITVLVGPEGDFSIDEVNLAIEHGYESVSLGNSRLRTETAGLAAIMMSQLVQRL